MHRRDRRARRARVRRARAVCRRSRGGLAGAGVPTMPGQLAIGGGNERLALFVGLADEHDPRPRRLVTVGAVAPPRAQEREHRNAS